MSKDITPLPASSGEKDWAHNNRVLLSGEKKEQEVKEMPTAEEWLREYEILRSVMPLNKAIPALVDMVIAKYESVYC